MSEHERQRPDGRWASTLPTRRDSLRWPTASCRGWRARQRFVLAVGLYLGFTAPEDFQQGITVRIMYIHVPFAWLAMLCYSLMALAALGTLVWRHPLADVALKAAAPIGAVFTALALATGSIWGKPMWGTWWVWDARLTSVFVLFLMYLGILALTRAIDDPAKSARAAAIITLVGFINIPIIKFSVDWWNTLHQPASVFRLDGPTIDAAMLWPLMVMAAGFTRAVPDAAPDGDAHRDLPPPGDGDAPDRGAPRRRGARPR